MNWKHYLLLCLSCILFALVIFAYQKEWIILNLPFQKKELIGKPMVIKKKCLLFYFKENNWHHEVISLIWKENNTENCMALLEQWLLLLKEEKIINKKIVLENIAEQNQKLFISFDQPLFDNENTIDQKLKILNGLVKTLLENGIIIKSFRILVHNQPLQDSHLDFTYAWDQSLVMLS